MPEETPEVELALAYDDLVIAIGKLPAPIASLVAEGIASRLINIFEVE